MRAFFFIHDVCLWHTHDAIPWLDRKNLKDVKSETVFWLGNCDLPFHWQVTSFCCVSDRAYSRRNAVTQYSSWPPEAEYVESELEEIITSEKNSESESAHRDSIHRPCSVTVVQFNDHLLQAHSDWQVVFLWNTRVFGVSRLNTVTSSVTVTHSLTVIGDRALIRWAFSVSATQFRGRLYWLWLDSDFVIEFRGSDTWCWTSSCWIVVMCTKRALHTCQKSQTNMIHDVRHRLVWSLINSAGVFHERDSIHLACWLSTSRALLFGLRKMRALFWFFSAFNSWCVKWAVWAVNICARGEHATTCETCDNTIVKNNTCRFFVTMDDACGAWQNVDIWKKMCWMWKICWEVNCVRDKKIFMYIYIHI